MLASVSCSHRLRLEAWREGRCRETPDGLAVQRRPPDCPERGRETERQTHRHTHTHRERESQRGREAERQRGRHGGREGGRDQARTEQGEPAMPPSPALRELADGPRTQCWHAPSRAVHLFVDEVDWPLAKDASPASTKNKNTFKFSRWICPQNCQRACKHTKAALAGVASRFHHKVWS